MNKTIRNLSICLGLILGGLSLDANVVRADSVISQRESYLIADRYRDYRRNYEDEEDYDRRDRRRNRREYYNRRDRDRRRNRWEYYDPYYRNSRQVQRWCDRQARKYDRGRRVGREWDRNGMYATYRRICGDWRRNGPYRYY
ncbi:MAG: hypothetical protein QNJ38_06820 [Prochloraceae cyanobacterium]|nr:hypothetical protein [Prochloraceae cyanobacterium]